MKNLEKKPPVFSAFAVLSVFPVSAFAYLDPGTGSIILQGLIGAIAVAMATGKMWWYKIKGIFSSNKEPLQEESANDHDPKVK